MPFHWPETIPARGGRANKGPVLKLTRNCTCVRSFGLIILWLISFASAALPFVPEYTHTHFHKHNTSPAILWLARLLLHSDKCPGVINVFLWMKSSRNKNPLSDLFAPFPSPCFLHYLSHSPHFTPLTPSISFCSRSFPLKPLHQRKLTPLRPSLSPFLTRFNLQGC